MKTAKKAVKNESIIGSRGELARTLGLSFAGKRDIYESCGYPKTLSYQDYRNVYDRGDIGKTVIAAYPDATWVHPPVVRETEEVNPEDTPFEKKWKDICINLPIYTYINRADTLCGIGSYGALFLGFDDGKEFDKPVVKAKNLRYLRPLSEISVAIDTYNTDRYSSRFGLPEMYNITFNSVVQSSTGQSASNVQSFKVHWTRILHIADNKDESDVFGVPRLQPVYNRLYDCMKVLSCSSEMFWQGAFQGLAFEADAESQVVDPVALEAEIQKYVHGLQRYMQLQGITTKPLSSPVANPKAHIDAQLLFISATTRIPLRVLTGSERGELSSVQDENNWKDRLEERRLRFATDDIMKPLLNRLVEVGVLPSPKLGIGRYYIEWSSVSSTTYKQQMETSRIITDALRIYVKEKVYLIIKPDQYLEKVMKFDPEQIKLFGTKNAEEIVKIYQDEEERKIAQKEKEANRKKPKDTFESEETGGNRVVKKTD